MLFTKETCSGLTDRFAAIASTLDVAAIAARYASPPGDLFALVTLTDDYNVEKNFIDGTYTLEQSLSGVSLLTATTATQTFINSFDTHTKATAALSFDSYLTTSGLQVPEYFAQAYVAIRGQALSARNVFCASDIVLATLTKTGTDTYTFGLGTSLGTGTGTYSSSPFNTGEQRLLFVLPSGVSTGATSVTFTCSGLNDSGNLLAAAASFPLGTVNAHAALSSSVKLRSVTNASIVADSVDIPVGTVIAIKNERERLVVL